jgi:AmmeMemoRadiSam system protein A
MNQVYLPFASQRKLMEVARQTLENVVRGAVIRKVASDDPYLENARHGAFVTLFNQDELRGCIGTCIPVQNLRETVAEMTRAAATHDSRVRPVRVDELEKIRIDVSVLSKLMATAEPMSLTVGEHGLHVARGCKRGLLLPQVAVEHGWDMQTFLEQTCVKAGLAKEAWTWRDTVVSGFTALLIEEET